MIEALGLFDSLVQGSLAVVILDVDILDPGKQIVYRFLCTLVAGPMQWSLPLVIRGFHIESAAIEKLKRESLVCLSCHMNWCQARFVSDVELGPILIK